MPDCKLTDSQISKAIDNTNCNFEHVLAMKKAANKFQQATLELENKRTTSFESRLENDHKKDLFNIKLRLAHHRHRNTANRR